MYLLCHVTVNFNCPSSAYDFNSHSVQYAVILRTVVRKRARDSAERYCGWF